MSIDTANADVTFVPLRQVCLKTLLTGYRIKTLAIAGRIRTEVLPGSPPRYCLEDALALSRAERVAKGEYPYRDRKGA